MTVKELKSFTNTFVNVIITNKNQIHCIFTSLRPVKPLDISRMYTTQVLVWEWKLQRSLFPALAQKHHVFYGLSYPRNIARVATLAVLNVYMKLNPDLARHFW